MKHRMTYFRECGEPAATLAAATWLLVIGAVILAVPTWGEDLASKRSRYRAELIFPLHSQHNHAPAIVSARNGDLLVSWYRGSGERQADDVAIWGARRKRGQATWSAPFLMADTPGFPDCNTSMMIDRRDRLWLFWPTILANTWESCLTNYRISSRYGGPGAPVWEWQGLVLLKPQGLRNDTIKTLDKLIKPIEPLLDRSMREEIASARRKLDDKLYQRLGWQPRCKPTVLPSGRILLPLYTDTFSMSIMAISDDGGRTWFAGKPIVGLGNIQPSVVRRADGTLVAYMRENGVTGHVRVSESKDDGITWGPVTSSSLRNPGSGLDAVRLANGHFLLVYNDTRRGRHSLAVSLSDDEGRSWKWTRHLERTDRGKGSFHYPAVIQDAWGTIHVVYSYFVAQGKTMKHAQFNEAWVMAGDR